MDEPTVPSDLCMTPRQMQLLDAIAASRRGNCCSPTITELARRLNLSRSTIFEHIAQLREKGLLSAQAGRARSLTPTSAALALLDDRGDPRESLNVIEAGIPLAGVVAAGTPIEAVENTETLTLTSYFGLSDDLFALEVRGDSMIDEDIRDGDYVICKRSPTAADGQLVVAIVDDEAATLKRFYRQPDRARLEPANSHYEPIYARNCRIEAVVVGLMRKL